MTRILPRVLPWSPSARQSPQGKVRVLGRRDTAALLALLDQDPVSNIFTRSQLAQHRSAVPDGFAHLLGINGESGLESACWIGANISPTVMSTEHARAYAQHALDTRQRFASVFGPADSVLAMREVLATGPQGFFDVRENQPLMSIRHRSQIEPQQTLRVATLQDFDLVLPASASMFEEELGYSPLENGGGYYRSRVRQLIREGHTLIDTDEYGEIIFKADLGTVTTGAVQIQGVWISPRYRGQGLAAGYMSATVAYGLRFAPAVSLYVNNYNQPAIRSYEKVGFEQVGTFATILF